MKMHVCRFEELTVFELYEILKLRNEVFVVEQNCVYNDIDGIDPKAIHLWLEEDGSLLSYLRVFPVTDQENTAQIGRVVSASRGKGYGRILLHEAVKTAEEILHAERLVLEAQTYAVGFYEKEGFAVCSDEFLEDGIPHVKMELHL